WTSTAPDRPTPSTPCVTWPARFPAQTCTSSPVPTRWTRSCPGRTPTSCSGWHTSSASPGRATSSRTRTCPRTRRACSRCRRWRAPPAAAGTGSGPACRSGTWSPTGWCSTSINTTSTGREKLSTCEPTVRGPSVTVSERAIELTVLAAQAAADKLAHDIAAIDVSEHLVITDVFVLASASNERQVQAVVDAIEERLLRAGAKPVRREGERDGRWVLLDYVDIVVHVQHADE